MAIQYIDSVKFAIDAVGKNVLARFDFNVPLDEALTITDSTRIDLALPTIKKILASGVSKLILMAHLGRPKGKRDKKFSLAPVAEYLAQALSEEVVLTETPTDSGIKQLLRLQTVRIVLLENIRFDPREVAGDADFARELAKYGDLFVMDAFGTAHRTHASTYHLNAYFPGKSYGGPLMKAEIAALTKIVQDPAHPFIAMIGGAKVSDKIKIIEKLMSTVDKLLIGGAMAYPFLKAGGHQVGQSLCSDDDVLLASRLLATDKLKKIELPIDHIVATEFAGIPIYCGAIEVPVDKMALDIGEKTVAHYCQLLTPAKTVLWNGPMGLFERPDFAAGTFNMARHLAQLKNAFTVIGGGDSVSAVNKAGLNDKMSHISTGGGASLEFIEQGTLPGIQALKFGLR